VTVAGWRAGYREIVDADRLANLPIERWRHEIGVGLRRPVDDAFTHVAEFDGDFAGYCYVAAPGKDADVGPEVAELGALYVDPAQWRKGAADALVRVTLERLAALRYEEVVLWTFHQNAPAIALYERHGWRRDGAEKIHERSGKPVVRFRRPVTMDA
jgi:ribosomal protein S18 acetylase RimI-like enzyme